jgi:NAD(P)-dependent dehydrogenase (short-subunit alcohol dehydrogenase family)
MKNILNKKIFKGKTVFITGATGKIGKKISNSFGFLGANLIITDKKERDLLKFKKSLLRKYKVNISYFSADLSNFLERENLIKNIKLDNNKIDFFINNAAVTGTQIKSASWTGSLSKQDFSVWGQAIEINLSSIFHLLKGLSPLIKKNSLSSIINVGSIYAEKGPDLEMYKNTKMGSPAAYLASKGGLLQLTRWLASSLSPIRVNMVSPGGIYNNQPDIFYQKYIKKVLIKRMCNVGDVANVIVFLCSPLSSYITAQNIKVDGGYGSF